MVGLGGLEPPASSLSGMRSNQAELQALLEITAQKHKSTTKSTRVFVEYHEVQELRERIEESLFRLRHTRQHDCCPASLERR